MAEDWQWGSAWRLKYGTEKQKKLLSIWPTQKPKDYLDWLNKPQTEAEEESIDKSIQRSSPFGKDNWTEGIIKKFNLELTIGLRGRPKKGS